MKSKVEKRKPNGALDYISLAVTTFGVGYLPLAPGTWGSLVAVGFYALLASSFSSVRYSANLHSPESLVAIKKTLSFGVVEIKHTRLALRERTCVKRLL